MPPPPLVQAMRLPFLTGSLMPVVIVATWASVDHEFSWPLVLLTLLGVGLLQVGGNTINDYYDAAGSDPLNQRTTPFSGGSRVIQEGGLSRKTMLGLSLGAFALAGVCGAALVFMGRPWVLAAGGAGLLGAWLYSGTALAFMRRSLGELVLFLVFGPVLTWGAGYVFTGQFTWQAFVLGLPTGWVILAVLWINQFPDSEADRAAGKNNLVVRMGTATARWGYLALMLAAYPTLALMAHFGGFTAWLYLGWLSLPLALKAISICWRHHDDHQALIPGQALTIMTHLTLALLMVAGLLVQYFTQGVPQGG